MACPTCDATLECCARLDYLRVFHCSRCGTVKVIDDRGGGGMIDYVPKLVERCRKFGELHRSNFDEFMGADWYRLGIFESIGPKA